MCFIKTFKWYNVLLINLSYNELLAMDSPRPQIEASYYIISMEYMCHCSVHYYNYLSLLNEVFFHILFQATQ